MMGYCCRSVLGYGPINITTKVTREEEENKSFTKSYNCVVSAVVPVKYIYMNAVSVYNTVF